MSVIITAGVVILFVLTKEWSIRVMEVLVVLVGILIFCQNPLSAIVVVPYASYEELISARMEFVNSTITQRAGLQEKMAMAQHKFESDNISVLPHKQTKCERPYYLVWTHMSEERT